MQLTSFTDYSLRVLMFLGTVPKEQLSSIKEISTIYNISNNHISKVVYQLGKLGLIETIRGRNGGIRLARPASEINIGAVVRKTEDNMNMAECFDEAENHCIISPACRLKHVLNTALKAYLSVLDEYTLEDLMINKDMLRTLFENK
ncbi:MAG TPA: Rrf2 family transcriptional regulator [Bacilli bacterium]|nr:Rrf2 family transcriptional regulator [Bacilli bacterium]